MDTPDWILALRAACEGASQTDVATRIGISQTAISLLLKGTYGADTSRMERRVREKLMNARVDCPHVRKPITLQHCETNRNRTNNYGAWPLRLQIEACSVCPKNPNRKVVPK